MIGLDIFNYKKERIFLINPLTEMGVVDIIVLTN